MDEDMRKAFEEAFIDYRPGGPTRGLIETGALWALDYLKSQQEPALEMVVIDGKKYIIGDFPDGVYCFYNNPVHYPYLLWREAVAKATKEESP